MFVCSCFLFVFLDSESGRSAASVLRYKHLFSILCFMELYCFELGEAFKFFCFCILCIILTCSGEGDHFLLEFRMQS